MYRILLFFILFALSSGDERGPRVKRIVGGEPAMEPPLDDPTIFTNFAGKAAKIQGVRDFPHYVFKGIKYAYPPTGKNRFNRPRERLVKGLVNATAFAPPCIQLRPGTGQIIGSEDCLALNVFTPELPTGTEGLPVVVWIHGGGFRYGSASQYGVRHLVGKRLVVVTIQYRLGSLGFLSSGTKHLPGNVALWDMALAVQWIRNYIGFFGGNPYKIVVMGHGTGASSVLMVALSKIAKGITGVVAMSGTAVSNWATDNTPQHTAKDVADENGCPTVDPLTMVKCLQSLPPESIIKGDSKVEFSRLRGNGFMGGLGGGLGSAPVTEGRNDGRSLPGLVQEDALDEMDKGDNPKVPLLTGICKDETRRAVKGQIREKVIEKIQKVPDFLQNDLVGKLKQAIPVKWEADLKKFKEDFKKGVANLENTFSRLIPPNFKNYVEVQKNNIKAALNKVSDITNDALFNVPAFLTVDKWATNGAPTFLYSFEHAGKNQKGFTFLNGSPLVGNGTHHEDDANDTVGHGDDLAYIFDAYDLDGAPLHAHELAEDDLRVREIFTQMIADFARFGAPKINDKPVLPFSPKLNNFIQVRPKPALANNFKFCEMALWLNIAERLKTSTCEFLEALDASFKNMQKFVRGLVERKNLKPEALFEQINKIKEMQKNGINIFDQKHLGDFSPENVFKRVDEWKLKVDNDIKNKTEHLFDAFKNGNNQQGLDIWGKKDKGNETSKPSIFDYFNKKNDGNQASKPTLVDILKQNSNDKKSTDLLGLPLNGVPNKANNEQNNSNSKPDLFHLLTNKQNNVIGNNALEETPKQINLGGNTSNKNIFLGGNQLNNPPKTNLMDLFKHNVNVNVNNSIKEETSSAKPDITVSPDNEASNVMKPKEKPIWDVLAGLK
ncbi:unnamed protein product [Phyllotreta striolata]|uniref:Carboxylesterase type B domain-containing protein n=1 Tax=Phyllotreta striolata TaxID=444603 RepID=A0A9N9XNF5_PHYSR|nr:unnamed protein product [Phyllotreta striolata]